MNAPARLQPRIILDGSGKTITQSEQMRAMLAGETDLVGETMPVLAERGAAGYGPNHARIALPVGTAAGPIVAMTVRGTMKGLLV